MVSLQSKANQTAEIANELAVIGIAKQDERKKQFLELKEKKLKALNDNLAKIKAQEKNLDKKIGTLKKTIEEEKETVRTLEQKYPFIHTVVSNR